MPSWPVAFSAKMAASLSINQTHNNSITREQLQDCGDRRHVRWLTCDDLGWVEAASGQSWSPLWTIFSEKKFGYFFLYFFVQFFLFCFFNLRSIDGLEWPDINWPIPVSGDHHPFSCSHTTHDVIHTSDDGNFGKTNDSILKVLRVL